MILNPKRRIEVRREFVISYKNSVYQSHYRVTGEVRFVQKKYFQQRKMKQPSPKRLYPKGEGCG